MPDRHKRTPISIRPPEGDRAWLEDRAAQTGRPVRRIITDAIARERAAMTETTRLTSQDRWLISRAREVAPALRADGTVRDQLAGLLLTELADLAERLDGHAAPQATEGNHEN